MYQHEFKLATKHKKYYDRALLRLFYIALMIIDVYSLMYYKIGLSVLCGSNR